MHKLAGLLLITAGIVLIVFSVIVLAMAFDLYANKGTFSESVAYTMGSIVFPLLLTVLGRWMLRKGRKMRKQNKV